MSSNKANRVRKSFNYEDVYLGYQRTEFGVEDYVQNPLLIKKLSEDKEIAHAYSSNLEKFLNEVISNNRVLEIQNKELEIKLEEAKNVIEELRESSRLTNFELGDARKSFEHLQREKYNVDIELIKATERLEEAHRSSFTQFLISTAATVTLAIGVNIVTSIQSDWKGWLLIVIGIILGIIAFFIARKKR